MHDVRMHDATGEESDNDNTDRTCTAVATTIAQPQLQHKLTANVDDITQVTQAR